MQPGLSVRDFWEANIAWEEKERRENQRSAHMKPYSFPKWRSTDALSASLVASNSVGTIVRKFAILLVANPLRTLPKLGNDLSRVAIRLQSETCAQLFEEVLVYFVLEFIEELCFSEET
ncbi:unnamed protein product [Cylicostephanus goldi]|uniref:Uncharacterized protein n=1 Tax=Cylicostephanus goldi TaxID=71465 RepID=A0A3P7QF84_CYLGO|nr:unnamed protein product [Cylicostephanus goldi]